MFPKPLSSILKLLPPVFPLQQMTSKVPHFLGNIEDMSELCSLVSEYLRRPPDSSILSDWASYIVDISYEFPLLKPGLVIYDLPGASISDQECIQLILRNFLQTIKPIVVFVYSNATISDGEVAALEFLHNAQPTQLPMFFISNKFDIGDFESDYNWKPNISSDEFLSSLIERREKQRYQFLLERSSYTRVPPDETSCTFFACFSAQNAMSAIWRPWALPIISKFGDIFSAIYLEC